MAKQKDKTDEPAKEREQYFVVGNPQVAVGGDVRLNLSGELTEEQYDQLGDRRVAALRSAGHLRTQADLDQAEADRKAAADRLPPAGVINPNFGTPAMSPAAMYKASGNMESIEEFTEAHPELDSASGPGKKGAAPSTGGGSPPTGDAALRARSIEELDISERARTALSDAKLRTVGDLIDEGNANEGLTHIEGVGEATQEEIRTAVGKLAANK